MSFSFSSFSVFSRAFVRFRPKVSNYFFFFNIFLTYIIYIKEYISKNMYINLNNTILYYINLKCNNIFVAYL